MQGLQESLPTLNSFQEMMAQWIRRIPSGRWKLMRSLVSGPQFVAKLPGSKSLRFEVEQTNLMPWTVFCTGIYDAHETSILLGLLEPGSTFVDVGANWGYYTLLGAEKVGPTGRVFSIEADLRNHGILTRNLVRNGLKVVSTVNAAAGSGPGMVELVGYVDNQANRGVSHIRGKFESANEFRLIEENAQIISVRADTIDALLDEAGIGNVDLLKMDIEGAEALALPPMKEGLEKGRYRRVLVEIHANVLKEYGSTANALLDLFQQANYKLWVIEGEKLKPLDVKTLRPDRSQILAIAPGVPEPVLN